MPVCSPLCPHALHTPHPNVIPRGSGHQDPRILSLKVLEAPHAPLCGCPTHSLSVNPSIAHMLTVPQHTAAFASRGPNPFSIFSGNSGGEEPAPGFLEQVKLEHICPTGRRQPGKMSHPHGHPALEKAVVPGCTSTPPLQHYPWNSLCGCPRLQKPPHPLPTPHWPPTLNQV